MIHIISDTHFFHENIKIYEGRPDNHTELIVENWNKLVRPTDTVIHLGDVIFGKDKEATLTQLMLQLNGKKILCKGNHDYGRTWGSQEWFMKVGFDFVVDYFVYDKYAFSHCPLTPLPKRANFHFTEEVEKNIHGHFHRKIPTGPNPDFPNELYDSEYYWNHKEKYQLVQVEDELRPFSLEEVLGGAL